MEPEKNVVASLALHAVLEPVFKEVSLPDVLYSRLSIILAITFQLEADDKNLAAVQTLRNAFTKVSVVY